MEKSGGSVQATGKDIVSKRRSGRERDSREGMAGETTSVVRTPARAIVLTRRSRGLSRHGRQKDACTGGHLLFEQKAPYLRAYTSAAWRILAAVLIGGAIGCVGVRTAHL